MRLAVSAATDEFSYERVNMIITIRWKAFGNQPERNRFESEATLDFGTINNNAEEAAIHRFVCNIVYRVTNLQEELEEFGYSWKEIDLWNRIRDIAPANRTHTSLSVGDEIAITDNNKTTAYRCAEIGWEKIGTVEFAQI